MLSAIRSQGLKFFEHQVPFGENKKLVRAALKSLGFENVPYEKVDIQLLSKTIIDLSNKPSKALVEQNLDQRKNGLTY